MSTFLPLDHSSTKLRHNSDNRDKEVAILHKEVAILHKEVAILHKEVGILHKEVESPSTVKEELPSISRSADVSGVWYKKEVNLQYLQ